MKKKIPIIIVFITFLVIFFTPLRDTDFGWHYRCGQLIVNEGRFCSSNEFTTLLPSYHWFSPAHGYQIFLYFIYSNFGFLGIMAAYSLLSAIIFTALLTALRGNKTLNFLLFLLAIWLSWEIFEIGLRSQILSIYFFAILLTLIEISERKIKYSLMIPPILLIWANSHPGFFLGVIILLLYAVRTLYRFRQKKAGKDSLILILGVCLISLGATLINPYGLKVYDEILRHTEVPLKNLIAEWVPPQQAWQIIVITLSAAVVFTALIWKRSDDLLRLGLLVITAVFALQARRNLPLFYFSAFFALTDKNLIPIGEKFYRKLAIPEIKILTIIAVILVILQNKKERLPLNDEYYCLDALVTLPCKAAAFMTSQKPGNIFNTYEWGGFLIWKLPKFKIFVDGRMPSWDTSKELTLPVSWRGKSPYTIYIEALQMQKGWEEIIRNYKTDYIMIQSNTFLDLGLKQNPRQFGFEKIYDDGNAAIYRSLKNFGENVFFYDSIKARVISQSLPS